MTTTWTEPTDAISPRGWLKAITAPFSLEKRSTYTQDNMPVWDEEIQDWREQSTLGCYAAYDAHTRNGHILAIAYVAGNNSKWFFTVAEAREWIEKEAQRMRPELAFQVELF